MKKRKSPKRHNVRSHTRKGKTVNSFTRGRGNPISRIKIKKENFSKESEILLPTDYDKIASAVLESSSVDMKEKRSLLKELARDNKNPLIAIAEFDDINNAVNESSNLSLSEKKKLLRKLSAEKKRKMRYFNKKIKELKTKEKNSITR